MSQEKIKGWNTDIQDLELNMSWEVGQVAFSNEQGRRPTQFSARTTTCSWQPGERSSPGLCFWLRWVGQGTGQPDTAETAGKQSSSAGACQPTGLWR